MKKNKFSGKAAISVDTKPSHYIGARIRVALFHPEYGYRINYLAFKAQANADTPDRFYALQVDSTIYVDKVGDDFGCTLDFMNAFRRAFDKQSAPRAILVNDRPEIDQCSLERARLALKAMGITVRDMTPSMGDPYDWVTSVESRQSSETSVTPN